MKKGDAIQLIVIILAFIAGFKTIDSLTYSIPGLVYLVGAGEFTATVAGPIFTSLLVAILQGVLCWLLLVRSGRVATFIYEKTNIGTSFKIVSQPKDLLYILFIVTGFYFLLQELPAVIKAFVNAFRSKATSRFEIPGYERPIDWTVTIIKLLLTAVLLIAARPIANYFAQNISDEPIVISDDIENIDRDETNTG